MKPKWTHLVLFAILVTAGEAWSLGRFPTNPPTTDAASRSGISEKPTASVIGCTLTMGRFGSRARASRLKAEIISGASATCRF